MRKWLWALLAAAMLLLAASVGAAEEARDITSACRIKGSPSRFKYTQMTDGKYTNYWYTHTAKHNYLQLTAPASDPIFGLYLCFKQMPDAYEIQVGSGDSWRTVAEGVTAYANVFYEIPGGAHQVRVYVPGDKKQVLGFHEIYAFSKGEAPDWVQRWEPTVEKADILFFSAHPDDELIFFAGGIPTAVDEGRSVAVAYFTDSNDTRRCELLNGLWSMGVRNYPVIGPFKDSFQKKAGKDPLANQYKAMGGKDAVCAWVAEVIRRLRPEVIVTHDVNGEYGHPQHMVAAETVRQVYAETADPAKYPESAASWGLWQAKKLYLHLWEENQSTFDWSKPLASLGGKTGLELATAAYELHVTQKTSGMSVTGTGTQYDNTKFGLYASEVGPDVTGGDFFENLAPAEAAVVETPAEVVTAVPEETKDGTAAVEGVPAEEDPTEEDPTEEDPTEEDPTEEEADTADVSAGDAVPAEAGTWTETDPDLAGLLPELTAKGFMPEGEFVHADEDAGLYIYINRTLKIVIKRSYEVPDARHPFYCFTADIWCDIEGGELPRTLFSNPDNPRKDPAFISDIAAAQQIVFATSTDYYNYRAGQKKARPKSYHVGIEVRNGEIFWDDPNPKPPSMPNYETLAFYRDGHLESLLSTERSAQEYLDGGAYDVYCFGPCLVRDGRLTDYVATANESYNPRYAFGVVEPGHYVAMLCEGRVKRSKGVQMAYLAQLLLDHGCQLAVNLDGGQTAVFAFMGNQLNQVVKTDPYGRKQIEALGFGVSPQVGTFTWK